MPGSPEQLKKFDTLHDFGNTASNRNAQIGLKYLGITMPEIALPSPQGADGPPVTPWYPHWGQQGYTATRGFKLDNCKTMVRSKLVSYERQATAAIDSCALENAWSFTNNGSGITWDQLWIKEGQPGYIDPNTLGDVVVIANGTVQNNFYESTLRKNNNPAESTKRNIVGHWILKYMFPRYTGNQAVGVTFDAAGGKLLRYFLAWVRLKQLLRHKTFRIRHQHPWIHSPISKCLDIKEPNSYFPQQGSDGWICTSQLYSKDWCNISFKM